MDRHYLDGIPISASTHLVSNANDNFYRHQVLTVIDETHQHTDAHLFSTRQLYENWGDPLGYKVSVSNQIADRLYFVADSAGIIPANEDSDITPPLWYTNYQNELVNQLNPSNQILCYIGMRLCTSMCNPDIPPGAPGACTDNYVSWQYLVPSQSATLSIMNNKASAWLPKRSSLCVGQGPAHLKAYDKWFFNKYIGTITVNLNFPGSSSVLYVPFNNIYSSYNDKIGSFLTY